MLSAAERLLGKLFSYAEIDGDVTCLDILVVCAGSFPSFFAFQSIILQKFTDVKKINFTLIEPCQYKINKALKNNSLFHFEWIISTLQGFLENTNKKFDIIYFEHPDLRTITIPLAILFYIYKNTFSLRKSMRYLYNICKKNTIIMASNMSKHENKQLKYLLKFYFKCHSRLIHFSHSGSSAFQCGLFLEVKDLTFKPNAFFSWNDRWLVLLTLFFIVSYIVILRHSTSLFDFIIPILLLIIVYHYHRPGKWGLLFIIISQLILFVFTLIKNLSS